jgi:hypothetical protein
LIEEYLRGLDEIESFGMSGRLCATCKEQLGVTSVSCSDGSGGSEVLQGVKMQRTRTSPPRQGSAILIG